MEYITVRQAARKWKVSERLAQQYCASGRIHGAEKFGGAWVIPADSRKPADPRKKQRQPAPTRLAPRPAPSEPAADLMPMPLMNGAFVPGHCREYVEEIADTRLRDIARAEYYYFSGRPEEAIREAER